MSVLNKISDLRPQRRNANKHKQRGMGQLEKSVQTDGWIGAITVAADGETFDGSARIEVAATTGFDDAIVVRSDGTRPIVHIREDIPNADDPRAVRLGIAANAIASHNLEWDGAILDEIAGEIDLGEFFGGDELRSLLSKVSGGGDDVPEVEDGPTRVQPGEIWQLGRHRVMCGDSTKAEDVARLMQGERWQMVVTDPPYGVEYEGGSGNSTKRIRLAGDMSASLYSAFLIAWMLYRDNKAAVYLWFAGTEGRSVYTAVEDAGLTVRALIIWNKLNAHFGDYMAQYMERKEPLLYCVKDGSNWYGPTNEVTVWDIEQPSKNEHHSTEKPIECMERPIRNSTKHGDIVVDGFLGSGTTLIACERTGRRCYGIEIEPRYCDVILKRWENETGGIAERIS